MPRRRKGAEFWRLRGLPAAATTNGPPARKLCFQEFRGPGLASGAIRLGCAAVNTFRYLLVAIIAVVVGACAHGNKPPKSRAKIYDNDSNPGIKMFDEQEKPGTPVGL